MLVQFSVENFLSFDKESIFSMVATSGGQHPKHLVPDVPRKGDTLLRGAAIYGANAAGKSNLIQALRFMQDLIRRGTRSGQTIPVLPFKLAKDKGRPSKFEIIFKTQGVLYQYGFRADAKQILEEWLYATPKSHEVTYFERATNDQGKVEVEVSTALAGRSAKNRQFLEFVAQGTRPNQLFLNEAADRNVPKIHPVIQWFQEVLVTIPAEVQANTLEVAMHQDERATKRFAAFLQSAGTGIDAITTVEKPFDFDTHTPGITDADREELREHVAQLGEADILEVQSPWGRRFLVTRGVQGEPVRVDLKMQHRASDGRLVTFDMDEESEGTQRLIHLLPALMMLKEAPEKVVVLDELDRRFHTLLSRLFVQTALDCDDEHLRSQLIFTTHDTNLLDLDLLRRDEIWFVEKDKGGASHLSSLAEYKIREDLKIEKGYLNGRFGALPFSGQPECLGWTSKEDTAFTNEHQEAVGIS